jgi:hypothetical protein
VNRSLRRHEGGNVVSVRLRGRPRSDCITDMIEGAVVAALGGPDDALVAELLAEVDPAEPFPEPPSPSWMDSGEEPF